MDTRATVPTATAKTVCLCRIEVQLGEEGILCESCNSWFHRKCDKLSSAQFKKLTDSNEAYQCRACTEIKSQAGGHDVSQAIEDLRDQYEASVLEQTCHWGERTTLGEISRKLDTCYNMIVKWRKNFFLLPRGKTGKSFIIELTRLINLFNNDTVLKPVALKSVMVFLPLMLQKPSRNSKAKDHCRYLEKRLELWKQGNLGKLCSEGKEIQRRLVITQKTVKNNLTKKFTSLMLLGKLSQAARMIHRDNGGMLEINKNVMEQLIAKHPEGQPADPDVILGDGELLEHQVEEVTFEPIDGELVNKAVMLTDGSGGPTLVDSDCWKHIVCSKNFKQQQASLCDAIAQLARKLCISQANPGHLQELLACRLIPLDKKPGVRPIGIGEILRRIIGKCVTMNLRPEIESSAGGLQTCAGHKAGIEAAIHAVHDIYDGDECEGLFLVDATNAFNSLNRQVALGNMKILCPPFFQYLENTYVKPSRLYLQGGDGEYIYSSEGTTQGDNCAMGFYAISTLPIIETLSKEQYDPEIEKLLQAWFADDSSAAGTLMGILKWWIKLLEVGPKYGYYPNPKKCVLIVKNEELQRKAEELFEEFGIEITTSGQRHLGAIVGTEEYKEEYIRGRVQEWIEDVKLLADIATSEPQCAYSAMVFAIQHRWKFIQRTVPNISSYLQELEHEIHHTLLTAIIGREISDTERDIIALPIRYGGLGIPKPDLDSDFEYAASRKITESMKKNIISQEIHAVSDKKALQEAKSDVKREKENRYKFKYHFLFSHADASMKRALETAKEKGASSWLTSLPLDWLGYSLNRQEFRDSIALRYNWRISDLPTHCGCGKPNDIDHCLSCKLGGYVIMRHNQIRNTTAKLLTEVCHDVQVEPHLIPVNNHEEVYDIGRTNAAPNARLDVSARGVWSPYDRTFLDIRVTHPNCLSNRDKTLKQLYQQHEKEKKDQYNLRVIHAERGNFTPLVFLTTGGMAPECKKFFNRLSNLIAEKKKEDYKDVVSCVRTKLRFAMLKSTLIAIRGFRGKMSTKRHTEIEDLSFNLIPTVESGY